MIDGDENDRSEPNESLIMDPLSENLLGTVESTANTDIHEKRKRSLAECVVLSVSGFKKPRMSADSGVGEEVEEVVSSPLHPETIQNSYFPIGSSIVEATVAAQPGDRPTEIAIEFPNERPTCRAAVDELEIVDDSESSAASSESALHGTRFCRICLESEGDTPLISPCLCRGSAGLCHSACLQTWLRTKETSKPSDLLRCGVCKGRYHVKIAYEEEGNRISNTKDLFKLMLWFYCVCFVILAPLLIYRSCMDYLTSRSPYILFITILNCLGFVAYLLFSVYAVNAWIIPAVERWFNSNRRLVVRPEVQEKDGEIADGEEVV